jgi:hypothetical protein
MRKYFLEDIDNNVVLKEKHIYSLRNSKISRPISYIKPRFYYLIYKIIKVFPKIRSIYLKREREHLQSLDAQILIDSIKPKILVSTYPVSFMEAMLLYAGNKNPTTKTLIHLLSWDNITCKGHFPQLADEYIAWGPIMRDEFIKFYNIDPSKIHMCGVPHFDVHFLQKSNIINKEPKFILFGMSAQRFVPNEIDIVEWLSEYIEIKYRYLGIHFYVRPHPQNITGGMTESQWLKRLLKINKENTKVDMPLMAESKIQWSLQEKDMLKMSNLLQNCLVFINSGSTMTIEALGLDKPTIITSFDGYENKPFWESSRRHLESPHLKKLISYGGVDTVFSFSELEEALERAINFPDLLSKERKNTYENECFIKDSNSTRRVLCELSNLL